MAFETGQFRRMSGGVWRHESKPSQRRAGGVLVHWLHSAPASGEVQNHRDHREEDQEVDQSTSHMEDPKPESPSKKQNDRQGDEHNPFLQSRMTATHRKVVASAGAPDATNYVECQRAEIDPPA
jgi:hypothetical protein